VNIGDDSTEYRGYFIARDTIEPTHRGRADPIAAENTRYAIMRELRGAKQPVNYAMTEAEARVKIDSLLEARNRTYQRPRKVV